MMLATPLGRRYVKRSLLSCRHFESAVVVVVVVIVVVVVVVVVYLKRCVHKLSKSQKVDLRKSPLKLWTSNTAKIQLNSGLAKYILYGSA